jgi:hypothetical protein
MSKISNMTRHVKLAILVAVTLVTTIIGIGVTRIPLQQQQQSAYAWVDPSTDPVRKAPIATDGNNIYIVWFNDKGTPNKNGEVMFKASTDGGKTFGDKINLSNTPGVDSINAEIDTAGNNGVVVTWWERANATSNEPVMKISNDNGKTFGPLLKLSTNGTIGK